MGVHKPLMGLKVLEFDAIGPVPFCGMMLADHGADIVRITRPDGQPNGIDLGTHDIMLRNRAQTLPLDLKSEESRLRILDLLAETDILLEGHRPGVMERLGLGPEACLEINPALVYCRITGYGQTGPLATHPGHDINFVAQTGALHAIGAADSPPPPPLSLVGDFGGGGMMGAFGILAALLSARTTGKGSVVDVAMADGTAMMMAVTYSLKNAGLWGSQRDSNILDGAAPFYCCYRTADGRFVAAGAIEPKFYEAMRVALHLTDPLFDDQMNKASWPEMRRKIAQTIAEMDTESLQRAIDVPDACLSWVASLDDVGRTGHLRERGIVKQDGDVITLATAPRFSQPRVSQAD